MVRAPKPWCEPGLCLCLLRGCHTRSENLNGLSGVVPMNDSHLYRCGYPQLAAWMISRFSAGTESATWYNSISVESVEVDHDCIIVVTVCASKCCPLFAGHSLKLRSVRCPSRRACWWHWESLGRGLDVLWWEQLAARRMTSMRAVPKREWPN